MTTPVIELREVSRRHDDGPPALHEASLTCDLARPSLSSAPWQR